MAASPAAPFLSMQPSSLRPPTRARPKAKILQKPSTTKARTFTWRPSTEGQLKYTAAFLIPPSPPFRKGRKNILALVPFLALALLALSGCGVQQLQQMARGEIQAPKVTYQGLKVYQPTSQGWPLGAVLLLDNPNNQALNLLGYDYQLWIEGKSVAQGTSQQAGEPAAPGADSDGTPHYGAVARSNGALAPVPAPVPVSSSNKCRNANSTIKSPAASAWLRCWEVLFPIPFRFQGEASPKEGDGLPEALPALKLSGSGAITASGLCPGFCRGPATPFRKISYNNIGNCPISRLLLYGIYRSKLWPKYPLIISFQMGI